MQSESIEEIWFEVSWIWCAVPCERRPRLGLRKSVRGCGYEARSKAADRWSVETIWACLVPFSRQGALI